MKEQMNPAAFLQFLTNIETNAERIYVRSQVNGRWVNRTIAEVSGLEAIHWIVQWFEAAHNLQSTPEEIKGEMTGETQQ